MPRLRSNIRAATSRKEGRSATYFGVRTKSGGGYDITSPVLSSISAGTPGQTTATITWTSDVSGDSQVFWGLTTAYTGATSPVMDFTSVTSHSVNLTGLIANTTYHYKVLTRRIGGSSGYTISADQTFTTAP